MQSVDIGAKCMFCAKDSQVCVKMLDILGYWTWICPDCLRDASRALMRWKAAEPMMKKGRDD